MCSCCVSLDIERASRRAWVLLPFLMGLSKLKGENAQLEEAWLQEQGVYVIKPLGKSHIGGGALLDLEHQAGDVGFLL